MCVYNARGGGLACVFIWKWTATKAPPPEQRLGTLREFYADASALERRAIAMAEKEGAQHLELRGRDPGSLSLPCVQRFYTFERTLDADPDANLLLIPRKQRAMVRKGIAQGLEADFGTDVETFYALYARSVRDLGTPVYPRRYFAALIENLGERCEMLVVRHGGIPISAVLSFRYRNRIMPYYAGSVPIARSLYAFDFMYWSLMRDASARGIEVFDFGRSVENTGAFAFKKNWGFEPQPLYYRFGALGTRQAPELTPNNPRYRFAIWAWKHLPLPIANRLGPWLWPMLA